MIIYHCFHYFMSLYAEFRLLWADQVTAVVRESAKSKMLELVPFPVLLFPLEIDLNPVVPEQNLSLRVSWELKGTPLN
jgi:hypothetical protein